MTKVYPTLYKKSSGGKVQEWVITVNDAVITITHGQADGKKQTDSKSIKSGKNIGKANETSANDQALLEAESKWKKQLDKGYVENLQGIDDIVYLPMLAQDFKKRGKDIKFPCYAQKKLDGTRSLFVNGNLISRKGKLFPNLEHIKSTASEIQKKYPNVILDGELYSDDLKFQRLVGLVKRESLNDEDKIDHLKIKMRVYDCIITNDLNATFETRYDLLTQIFKEFSPSTLTLLENYIICIGREIKPLHDQFVAEGYEGLILRNKDGVYGINKRSKDLQKYKSFLDDEYEVIGFTEGEGRAEGTVIWRCKTKDGKEFSVRPRGTEQERRDWFINGNQYINQQLTVRYFENTDDGVPRFPVGICFRSYE